MTYSYFQAYAYKRYKNADVIFAKSMAMADNDVIYGGNSGDGSFLKSNVSVKPSILRPEVGSKVIDAMKKAKGSVYFKSDYVPDEFEDSFGTIDWSSVNFDRDDRNGLSKNLNKLLDYANLSVYYKSHELLLEPNPSDNIEYFDGLHVAGSAPTISALTSGHVYNWSDELNDVFSADSEKSTSLTFDLGKIDNDWYVTSSSESLDNIDDFNMRYNIANVNELKPELQDVLKPFQDEATSRNRKTPDLKNLLLSSDKVRLLPELNPGVDYNSNIANLRVMFSDSVHGDGSPAQIKDDILNLANVYRLNESELSKANPEPKKPVVKTLSVDEIEF